MLNRISRRSFLRCVGCAGVLAAAGALTGCWVVVFGLGAHCVLFFYFFKGVVAVGVLFGVWNGAVLRRRWVR